MRLLNILSKVECTEFIDYFDSNYNYKDKQVVGSNIIHNSELAMDLCYKLRPLLESNIDYKLEPYQAWIRKYVRGNVLNKHWDGKADFAFSIMLGQSDNQQNPLFIYYNDIPTEIVLDVGDGYFFEGGTIEHERPPIKSDYLYGLYLGYKKINKETTLI
tara:strand:+ start:90 stop:566 length:477 start_codon:yes stop_codon:yes gene_type:complete